MQFLYPGFLFALAALAIPIIVHLFNFRKFKRVYFTNLKFLREIKQETQSKSQLKHLLVLLMRMLAITFLVLAFAQPYLPVSPHSKISGNQLVSIYVDNSFSMDAIGKQGNLLDVAKKSAKEIVSAYSSSDQFQLLTNDFEGKHQRLLSKEEFLNELKEVKSSPAVKLTREVLSRQMDALTTNKKGTASIYLISDFQKSSVSLPDNQLDSSIQIHLVPLLANTTNNVFIDSCWFETPSRQINQVEVLHVRIQNLSNQQVENAPIKLIINNTQRSLASFSLEPNSSQEITMSFTIKQAGIQQASLVINDYPVTFDDSYYFSFEVADKIKIVSINQTAANPALTSLFAIDSTFELTQVAEKSIDYNALAKSNLIVLNELQTISSGLSQELNRFVKNGGSLVVFPGQAIDLTSYNSFLNTFASPGFTALDTNKTRVDKINRQHPIYADVFEKGKRMPESLDLPVILAHYPFRVSSRVAMEALLRLQNGDVFLSKTVFGKGQLYTASVGLSNEFSNFTKHAIFVPTLFKIALFSAQPQDLFHVLGNAADVKLKSGLNPGDEVFHLKLQAANFDMVPEHRNNEQGTYLRLNKQTMSSGNYLLMSGKDTLQGIAFNYDRKESNLNCLNSSELEEQISKNGLNNFSLLSVSEKGLGTAIKELSQGKRYWKYCILLVLIFLAAEIILIRYWK